MKHFQWDSIYPAPVDVEVEVHTVGSTAIPLTTQTRITFLRIPAVYGKTVVLPVYLQSPTAIKPPHGKG